MFSFKLDIICFLDIIV